MSRDAGLKAVGVWQRVRCSPFASGLGKAVYFRRGALTGKAMKSVHEPETKFVQSILEDLIQHRIDFGLAVDKLLAEMGRGQRILVIDENLLSLEPELAAMGYTTEVVDLGAQDSEVKKQLRSRVLVTRNGEDFSNPEEMKKYYYGLVWITSRTEDEKTLAEKVKEKLMTSNFAKNLVQVVKA